MVLLIVGIGLLIFGGIVLLKFPHKPGGKISVGGFEVSSVGAGLPLMVLGVFCIYSSTGNNTLDFLPWKGEGSTLATQNADGCFDQYFQQLPENRISTLEVGVRDADLIGTSQGKEEPIGILFTQSRAPFGAIIFNFFPDNEIFKIESVVDEECQRIDTFSNSSRGGDRHVLQNWDTVEIPIGDRSYFLRLGYDGGCYQRKLLQIKYYRSGIDLFNYIDL